VLKTTTKLPSWFCRGGDFGELLWSWAVELYKLFAFGSQNESYKKIWNSWSWSLYTGLSI